MAKKRECDWKAIQEAGLGVAYDECARAMAAASNVLCLYIKTFGSRPIGVKKWGFGLSKRRYGWSYYKILHYDNYLVVVGRTESIFTMGRIIKNRRIVLSSEYPIYVDTDHILVLPEITETLKEQTMVWVSAMISREDEIQHEHDDSIEYLKALREVMDIGEAT